MQPLKEALEATTSHGLPRTVTNKPILIRVAWLLMYFVMLGLFLKGFAEFIIKLRSRQVTTSLEANEIKFQLPDIYACMENPISASYSSSIPRTTMDTFSSVFTTTFDKMNAGLKAMGMNDSLINVYLTGLTGILPQALPYDLLVDTVAHRAEQAVIDSMAVYNSDNGLPGGQVVQFTPFYDASFLRCFKWSLSSDLQQNIYKGGSNAGLVLTLLTDTTFNAPARDSGIYIQGFPVSVLEWPMSLINIGSADRRAGVRFYLTPPGEFPSDFTTYFSLSAGKYHTVAIGMSQQSYKGGQFDTCLTDAPDVQFVNPYDQTPYNQTYSYSYCYYYEYHRQYQTITNFSGVMSPLPWPLRGKPFSCNFSSISFADSIRNDAAQMQQLSRVETEAQTACQFKRPCTTVSYSVSISSADWPTSSSLIPFLSTTVKSVQLRAHDKKQPVPALDYLLNMTSPANMTSYVANNMMKVHLKAQRLLCDGVSFSMDYTLANFISDVGGIMGIYLGMSLLTLCELLEFLYDILLGPKRCTASKKIKTIELESTKTPEDST